VSTLPFGRQPVSEENANLKLSTFKPLEQPADSARGENRRFPDEHPNDIAEQERLRKGRGRHFHDRQQQDAERERVELEQQEIRELAATDREVRAHEQAHAAVGGKYAGSPVYKFVRGPDGISYAVSGEVSINTSPVPGNPEATIAKAQQIRRAASAPAQPSDQDRRVAAEAAQLEAQASIELRQERMQEITKEDEAIRSMAPGARLALAEESGDQVPPQSSEEFTFPPVNDNLLRRLQEMGVMDAPVSIGVHLDKNI